MSKIFTTGAAGKFFDGQSARKQQVIVIAHKGVQRGTGRLVIHSLDGKTLAQWELTELRQARDQARGAGIVLLNNSDNIPRLILSEDEAAGEIRTIAPNLTKHYRKPGLGKKIAFWAAAAVASVFLIVFVLIPALSDQLAKMIPLKNEVAIGKQTLAQIENYLGADEAGELVCTGEDGGLALAAMTARLAKYSDSPYDLDVRVFNDDLINAFAVPGGHIVLFKGLLKAADNPEEIAGVLAHEIGHVVHRDPTRLTLRAAGSVGILGMVFGDFTGGALALILTEQLIQASYSQDAEAQADAFSHRILEMSGLPAKPFAGFFLKLKDEYGEAKGLMSHLASHPDLDGRAQKAVAADSVGDKAFEEVLSADEWRALQSICD